MSQIHICKMDEKGGKRHRKYKVIKIVWVRDNGGLN